MAKEEKRIEILMAALKVISVVGFEGAKMEDIAKEAGVGKGTIYEYFDSKNTLFTEMLRNCTEQFQAGLAKTMAEGKSMVEKVRNLSRYSAEFLNAHALLMNSPIIHHSLSEEAKEQMKKDWNSIFKIVEDEIKSAIHSQDVRSNIDPEMAAAVIIGGVNQYTLRKLFQDHLTPEEIDHTGIAKMILTGLMGS